MTTTPTHPDSGGPAAMATTQITSGDKAPAVATTPTHPDSGGPAAMATTQITTGDKAPVSVTSPTTSSGKTRAMSSTPTHPDSGGPAAMSSTPTYPDSGGPAAVATLPAAPGGAAPALECRGLVKRFGPVAAVSGIDLAVEPGRIMALLGPSGCGKTTTLRLIAGFEHPDGGVIAINGQPVSGGGVHRPPEKRRVGMVFQEGALFPHLSVAQNIGYGLPKQAARARRIDEVLELVGLAGLGRRLPYELSGGQQQRVALGRALAPRPDLLLLDEPFSSLDPARLDQVRRDVVDILRASGATAVFVTHDRETAMFVGDVLTVMDNGRIEQSGPPEEVFHAPRSRFVAGFLGLADFLPAQAEGNRLHTEIGIFGGNGSAPYPPGGGLEVMLRPDDLEALPDESADGVITNREFRGSFYLYWTRLPSGATLRCLGSHTTPIPVGVRVSINLRPGHQVNCFRDGHLLPRPT